MRIFTQYKGLKKENYILFFGRIVTNMGAMIWPMLTMILNKKLGFNATETALFTIFSGVLFLPASLIGGRLADKFSKKHIIIYCDIISIIIYVISGFLPLNIYTLCFVLVGAFFQSLEGPAYQAMVAEITPEEKREKAFSLLYLGSNIGLILSPTIAGLLFNNYLWLCFVISGVAISFSTIMIGLFVNPSSAEQESKEDSSEEEVEKKSVVTIIKSSVTLTLLVLAMAFYEGAYSQYGYLMPLDIVKAYPDNGSVIYGTVNSLNCIIVVLMTPVLTMLLEKIDLSKKYALGVFLQAVSYAAFLLSFGVIGGYYASITIFTLGEILTTTVIAAFLSQRVSASYRGRIFGFTNFAAAFMQGVIRFISGVIFDNVGLGYAWAFSICITGVAVIAAFAMIFTDRKEFKELYE